MKLILLEKIERLSDLPKSVYQVRNMLQNGQIAFKSVFSEVKDFIENSLMKSSKIGVKDKGELEYILKDIEDNMQYITDPQTGNIVNDGSNLFFEKTQRSIEELVSLVDKLDSEDNFDKDILDRLNKLLAKKKILDQFEDKFDKDDVLKLDTILDEITRAVRNRDKETVNDKIEEWENELSIIDTIINNVKYSSNLDKYDRPFETAKNEEERRQIIANFFSDRDFWGPKIGYVDLRRLGSPLITELIYKGFNEIDNPFITFIKQMLPNKDINEDRYRLIHNLYVKGFITDDDLRNTSRSKVAEYIHLKSLYKQDLESIEKIIREASGKDEKVTDKKPWRDLIDHFGIDAENYKLVMSIINDEFNKVLDSKERLTWVYGLPRFFKEDHDKWMNSIRRTDISKDNFRDVLDYLNKKFAEKR